MRPIRLVGMLTAIWLLSPLLLLSAQGGETFTARLAWVPTTAAQRADVTGKGSATASLSGRTLAITGSFEGLVTPATAARLHRGVAQRSARACHLRPHDHQGNQRNNLRLGRAQR